MHDETETANDLEKKRGILSVLGSLCIEKARRQLIEVAQEEIPLLMLTFLWPLKVSSTRCPALYSDIFLRLKLGIDFVSSHSEMKK